MILVRVGAEKSSKNVMADRKITLVILAAGFATRLEPLTLDIPKQLLPVGDEALIDLMFSSLDSIKSMVDRTVLVTNEKHFCQFAEWSKISPWEVEVISDGVSEKENRLGAIGDLIFTLKTKKIDTDVLVVCPDYVLKQFDFATVITQARYRQMSATIAKLEENVDVLKLGSCLSFDKSGKITDFAEKPKKPFSNYYGVPYYFILKNDLKAIFKIKKESYDNAGQIVRELTDASRIIAVEYSGDVIHLTTEGDYKKLLEKNGRSFITLDFDETVYDTPALKEKSREIFSKYDLEFDSVYRHLSRHGLFSFKKLNELAIPQESKRQITSQLMGVIKDGEKLVYPDAREFLKSCNLPVVILTFGDTDFQLSKVIGSGIDKYANKIKVTQKNKHFEEGILKLTRIFVDDSLPTLVDIGKKDNRIKLFLIDRYDRYSEEKIPPNVKKIKKLTQVKC